MRYIAGIADIVDRYGAFVVDIWGVLHDGVTAYPGVIECLANLTEKKKQIVLLSNSGRRADIVANDLRKLDINPACYTAVITSGEFARQSFQHCKAPSLLHLGTRFYLFGSEHYNFTEGLCIRSSELEDADFVLALSIEGNPSTTDRYEKRLQRCIDRALPMVCVNPDLCVARNGIPGIGPGALAARYHQLGGQVIYFGKPHRPIYEFCLESVKQVKADRIVVVGDSLKTDIAGAQRCELDSILVGTGIHAKESETIPDDMSPLTTLCLSENAFPTMVARGFTW